MIRIHADSIVPKYPTGKWFWNATKDELSFSSWKSDERDHRVDTSNEPKFKTSINQIEEVTFRQEFSRPDDGNDDCVVKIEDIKNLVLFLAPSEMLTNKFIDFIHTKPVDCFLNALIIYFEYFLRLVEFILIRRDEISGKAAQIQSTESTKIKRIYSEHLSQYRLLLAREYSAIVMGNGEMAPYYHLNTLVNISNTYHDRILHESLLAFSMQVVWIAHHRKGYDVINTEMNRLFRSDHFKLTRKDAIEFSRIEQELLFGKNNRRVNSRRQNSPLIQEIAGVKRKNLPILWIGDKKYRGNDLRIQQIELEFIIPDSDLCLIDVKHGILGHQKILYNTMLMLDWEKVRERGHTAIYDPSQLINQPFLEIPNLDAVQEGAGEHFESYFRIKDNRFKYHPDLIKKWKRRDKVVEYIKSGGLVIDVIEKCKKELENIAVAANTPISVAGITQAFVARKKFLLKHT